MQSPVFGSVPFVFLLSQTASTLATSEVCFQSCRGWVHMWHLHTNTHWRGLLFWRCKVAEHRWVKWVVFGVSASWPPAGFSSCYSTLFSSLLHSGVRSSPPSFITNINSSVHVNTSKVHTHITVPSVILCSPKLFTVNRHSCMLHFTWQWQLWRLHTMRYAVFPFLSLFRRPPWLNRQRREKEEGVAALDTPFVRRKITGKGS